MLSVIRGKKKRKQWKSLFQTLYFNGFGHKIQTKHAIYRVAFATFIQRQSQRDGNCLVHFDSLPVLRCGHRADDARRYVKNANSVIWDNCLASRYI